MTSEGLDSLFAGLPEILTVQEVADLLRMHKQAIYKWLKEGTIPAYYRGRSWFIVRDELKDWMRNGSNQEAEDEPVATPASDDHEDTAGADDTENE